MHCFGLVPADFLLHRKIHQVDVDDDVILNDFLLIQHVFFLSMYCNCILLYSIMLYFIIIFFSLCAVSLQYVLSYGKYLYILLISTYLFYMIRVPHK